MKVLEVWLLSLLMFFVTSAVVYTLVLGVWVLAPAASCRP
jgi:hypothetical protein